MKTHIRLLSVAAAAGLSLALLAAGSPASSKATSASTKVEPTIAVVDTVSGPNFQAFWENYLIPLIQSKLGIHVTYTVGSGPELELQMKSWKQNHPEFSLFFVKGLDLTDMIESGDKLTKLYPNLKSAIPNEVHEPPNFMATNDGVPLHGEGLIFWRAQFDLVYNSAYVKHPPKTWQQFYADRNEFKGHIGLIEPDASSGGGRAFMYSFLKAFGVPVQEPLAQMEKSPKWKSAWAKWENFSKDLANPVASSPTVLFSQFNSGQVWITDYAQDYSLWSASLGFLPSTTRATALNDNVIGSSNAWIAVPAVDSPAQKAADYKIANLLLSKQVQLQMLKEMHEYPGTNWWREAPKSDWALIPPVNVAESHGFRMTNLALIDYLEQDGMKYTK
jgi:putative spermidine/putrescine transport system substrate-binding protein